MARICLVRRQTLGETRGVRFVYVWQEIKMPVDRQKSNDSWCDSEYTERCRLLVLQMANSCDQHTYTDKREWIVSNQQNCNRGNAKKKDTFAVLEVFLVTFDHPSINHLSLRMRNNKWSVRDRVGMCVCVESVRSDKYTFHLRQKRQCLSS